VTFEKLKTKLENEGLFEQQRKRELVPFPQKIGLITAKDSQAYKDFVKVLQERLGGIKIYYYPASVQGKDSISSIQRAFQYFNASGIELDVIALIRGGGSLEDLYSFNTEEVVKAIFSSKYPVICGVGHEGDVTLADLVADVRASTPSNAAELICYGSDHAMAEVKHFEYKIDTCVHAKIRKYVNQITRFSHTTQRFAYLRTGRFKNLLTQFDKACESIQTIAKVKMLKSDQNIDKSFYSITSKLKLAYAAVAANSKLLEALDYNRLLIKGYAIVYTSEGKILRNARDVSVGQSIKTQLSYGVLISNIERSDYD
jgi:exodeoxyribonuclease VII large subunit